MSRRTALVAALGVLALLAIVVTIVVAVQSGDDGTPIAAPDVRGLRLDVAESRLESLALEAKTSGGGTFGVVKRSNWWVCAQDPAAGTAATEVELFVERECSWKAPGVAGMALAQAEKALDEANVPYDAVDVEGKQPLVGQRWMVCGQRPTGGITTSRVRLVVARDCALPEVTGMTYTEARQTLEQRGLTVQAVDDSGGAVSAGGWRVCDQSPAAADAANKVTLTVARYCSAEAPDVEWLHVDAARAKLDAAGLESTAVTPSGKPAPAGWTVCDQDPEAGAITTAVRLFVVDQPANCSRAWPGRSREG